MAAIDTPERLKRTIRKLQSLEISFVVATRDLTTNLKTIQGVIEVAKHGDKYRLYTEDPPTVLSAIWEYVSANDLKILSVNTLGPSLEDVFVKLTGIKSEVGHEEEVHLW